MPGSRLAHCAVVRAEQHSLNAHFECSWYVHLNSERTVEPVRQDGSLAEKQQSHRALLFLVQAERYRPRSARYRNARDERLPPAILFRGAAMR